MIYHIVVGDMAATPLKEAATMNASLEGEVMVLNDILHVGPVQKEEGASFSALRSAFWQEAVINEKNPIQVNDMERLLELSNTLYKNEGAVVWFWMAPAASDICAYYWMLPYLSKHPGRFYVVNIAGLPFLDENGKVFYPKNVSDIPPKELVKARKLARAITPSEAETDVDEWKRLAQENGGIRTYEGGKKITSRDENYYDAQLISFCSQQFQKAHRIVTQALTKFNIPTGDLYLGWRLRRMAESNQLQLQGDITKTLRDFDVKLPGQNMEATAGMP